MKITILMVFVLVIFQANAQKVKKAEVPKIVLEAFSKAYPSAKEVKWSKEEGGFYEAEFELGKSEISATLDSSGLVEEVETEIKKGELPAAVLATLKRDYPDYQIEEAAKILSAGVTTYEAEVEKGKESFDLIFDANGQLIRKVEKKEEADKD